MNNAEHLLSCLAEECAEVAQRVSKALRFGLEEIQPGQAFTNAERIAQELNDLVAVVELLEEAGLLPRTGTMLAIEQKKLKVGQFMEYAKRCGTLSSS